MIIFIEKNGKKIHDDNFLNHLDIPKVETPVVKRSMMDILNDMNQNHEEEKKLIEELRKMVGGKL